MRKFSITLLLTAVLLTSGCTPGSKFDIDTPSGFRKIKSMHAKIKYHVVHSSGANVNVVTERFSGSLDEYFDVNVKQLKQMIPGIEIHGRMGFRTRSDLIGKKIEMSSVQKGMAFRQAQYYFEDGNTKHIITATAQEHLFKSYEKTFDECAASFRLRD